MCHFDGSLPERAKRSCVTGQWLRKSTFDLTLYADVDECESNAHNCHQLGICTNNFGSFSCHCRRGYTGNGTWCEGESELRI